ncbi:MAG: GLPGLI family protein, partial [Flavobacteriales bacterium]|nr:GLPGLI family protein [Flavobacteriales bacterium]
KKDFLGKIFLIKDSIKKHNWVLEKETKNIGVYKCYKATCIIKDRIENDSIKIVAWYTPEIPIGNGPSNFDGLPGLILEVNDGTYTIVCSEFTLNPTQKIKIREPKGGKKISQVEFDLIEKKKRKEKKVCKNQLIF